MNPLSEAAREASRRNGRLSKGPQTVLGRQISARNSFKHGLRGRLSTEPEFLPVWLRSFGERVSFLFGYITQRRREHLDRLLESMLLVTRADRLIGEELAKLAWLVADDVAPQDIDPNLVDLSRLQTLLAYRRRFSASRDRGIGEIVRGKRILLPYSRQYGMQWNAREREQKKERKRKARAERAAAKRKS
ncbi:MAG TPA: hypothetical protein PKE59_14980 [Novosphingobium sp.]|jgi:hypothetical protein|nr:hypothetical protein [Novosphingobium sp.]